MKIQNIYHLLQAALLLLLVSCTQEEFPAVQDKAQQLTISVTDGGYTSAVENMKTRVETRAVENGYTTEFTEGDACGFYMVRGGKPVYSNVKLTAEKDAATGGIMWKTDGTTLAAGMDGESYYLYYPYQETAKMAGKVNATDTTSDGDFFATLINDWQPEADQSDYTQGYTASDLMTATGSGSKADGKLSLSFSMTHRMALAVVEMPKTVYKFTDTSIPDYVIATTADFSGEAKPCRNTDGTYRYFVRPGQGNTVTLTGSYADGKKEFFITPNNISVSSYKTYKVDGAPTIDKDHNLQVGDYLLADGNIVGKDETLTEEQKASVIAIVFHAGHHENDASDYSATGIGQQKCHGYAVALQDATNGYCQWGVYGTELGCCPTDGSGKKQNNYSAPDIDWSGYAWTQKIITAAGGKDKLNATEDSGYPATYYAVVDYAHKVPSPANSTGWFLPSIGQMWNVYQNRASLFEGKTVVSGLKSDWYWSSSEYYRSPASLALYVSVYGGNVSGYDKGNRDSSVRPVLAF
mgnify:CR=1 FL=1